jgi:flagellar P-ring protein precursor FlgI
MKLFGISCWIVTLTAILMGSAEAASSYEGVRIKDMGRIESVRDNSLAGYGLVTGLAGTGDSSRSKATLQSVANMLAQFGVSVTVDQLNSRNVAAVMVTANLPPFTRPGDKLDVNVSSLGDARSLMGGTLLMMPLYGPDKKIYALAQGPLSVGGYQYDLNGNLEQKNHPTSAMIPGGATVENEVPSEILSESGNLDFVLSDPDFTTAQRIATSLNEVLGDNAARAVDAGRIRIKVADVQKDKVVDFIAKVENVIVTPDQRARIIVNERTGTIVSGGDVRISKVSISHGDLKVSIVTDYLVSQPNMLIEPGPGVRTAVVPQTRINVNEGGVNSVSLPAGTTVADLVSALNKIKTSTRDIISILQGIKRSGALHAELIIQ